MERDNYRISGIYKIKNILTEDFYVGSAIYIKGRWARHRKNLRDNNHPNKHLQSSWNKYGEDNFIFEIIEEVSQESKLIEREQYFMDVLQPNFNKSKFAASSLGCKHKEETKILLSNLLKGMEPSNKGKFHTEETKALMKQRWKERKENNFSMSEETKSKISIGLKGKKKSQAHIEKVRLANTGKKI